MIQILVKSNPLKISLSDTAQICDRCSLIHGAGHLGLCSFGSVFTDSANKEVLRAFCIRYGDLGLSFESQGSVCSGRNDGLPLTGFSEFTLDISQLDVLLQIMVETP